MKNIHKRLRSVWLAGFFLAWLLGANVAAANTIGNAGWQDMSVSGDGTGNLPAADLSGWFFSLNPQQPFPSQFDLSQPWTSAENIATMNYWLSLVTELGDDPSLLAQLYGLGMTDSQLSQLRQLNQLNSQQDPGNVPEPVTGRILGGGLAFLGFCAAVRARRMRRRR